MKYRALKDRRKLKSKIEKLIFKPITVSIDDMDKLEQKEIKKKRPIKNYCYDWLKLFLNPVRKTVCYFKDKFVRFLKKTH